MAPTQIYTNHMISKSTIITVCYLPLNSCLHCNCDKKCYGLIAVYWCVHKLHEPFLSTGRSLLSRGWRQCLNGSVYLREKGIMCSSLSLQRRCCEFPPRNTWASHLTVASVISDLTLSLCTWMNLTQQAIITDQQARRLVIHQTLNQAGS